MKSVVPALVALCAFSGAAGAEPADPLPSKLTLGYYQYQGYAGEDVNYRWRSEGTSVWVGVYRDRAFGRQARTGFDTAIKLADSVSLQPSLQAATGGFVGGSVNLAVGDPFFAIVGWGRTNLKPYFNLNFDPNDAVTLGGGWQGEGGRSVSVFVVADDRLHTRQKDWHVFGRWPVTPDLRLTLDFLHKTGDGDGGPVHASGLSATLDFPTWFLRLARDPKQNFSTQDATRLSAGVRF